MTDWTGGYLADLEYTFGYFAELNPLRARLALLDAGLVCPEIGVACELGFGQGISVNIHAAASPVRWFGADFNPAHTAFAHEVAAASGADVRLFEQSFAEFCGRDDLPEFDFVGLHGVWSWISPANQQAIIGLIHRRLKPGGVAYVSYNTLPGWAGMGPIRHLLTRHAELMAEPGRDLPSRIDAAIAFSANLLANSPALLGAYPQLGERLAKMKEQELPYLAHEFFNRNWVPLHFDQVADTLKAAKLTYACSASLLDHVDGLNLSEEQQAILRGLPEGPFRETARDMLVNQNFRRDYWVKGPRRLSPREQGQQFRDCRLVLVSPRDDVTLKTSTMLGEALLDEAIYTPILDLLADHQPRSIGRIGQALPDLSFAQLREALLVLVAKGSLVPAQDDGAAGQAGPGSERLNRYLIDKARAGSTMCVLACPRIGGGIALGRFHQLLLGARAEGAKAPADWAAAAWTVLSAHNEKILKDGKPLETPEENLAELSFIAEEMSAKRLPVLEALGVV